MPRLLSRRWLRVTLFAVSSTIPFAPPTAFGAPTHSRDLSVTCLGNRGGGATNLAVSWRGKRAADLTVWEDRDGDGRRDLGEENLTERRISPGISVLDLELGNSPHVAIEARGAFGRWSSTTLSTCGWATEFHHSDLSSRALVSAVYDDGHGPALYVGGWFHIAGSEEVWGIAKWDGRSWSPLRGPHGSGVWGGGFTVYAMAVYDDGTGPALYVGGWFSWAGWVPVRNIAKWNGREWSAVSASTSSSGLSDTVYSLAVFDDGSGPKLYAAGNFQYADGLPVKYIARWNGTAWSALSGPSGTGLELTGGKLAVFDDGTGPALYVSGAFRKAGGVVANGIARWNGTGWAPVSGPSANGIEGGIGDLAVFDDGSGPALYAAGSLTKAGGVPVRNVAKWRSSGWAALNGSPTNAPNGLVRDLLPVATPRGPRLIAAGDFTEAGGVAVGRIAEWDGTSWSALSGVASAGMEGPIYTLAVFDDGLGPSLFAGGYFWQAGDAEVNYIAKWNGSVWSSLSGASGVGPNSSVNALAVWNDGSGPALYAGGRFTAVGHLGASSIARWNGRVWTPLAGDSGEGVDDDVTALAVFDDGNGPALFVAGWFDWAGGQPIARIAKWDGTAWSSVGGMQPWAVHALVVHDDGSGPALYAAGEGISLGVGYLNPVLKWNGQVWSALPGFLTSNPNRGPLVNALASFDDGSGPALYAGGLFEQAGDVSARNLAKWSGAGWHALEGTTANGVDSGVLALGVHADKGGSALYVGGQFVNAGGILANHVARWDGLHWSALSGPNGVGVDAPVNAIASLNDGTGPQLLVGGDFSLAGGNKAPFVARWNGTSWNSLDGPFGSGVSTRVNALAVFDDGSGPAAWVGGDFASAGGVGSSYLARWQCRSPFSFADGFESGTSTAWGSYPP